MQRFLLGLVLIASLVATGFNTKSGEDFETDLGTVRRTSQGIKLIESDGTEYEIRSGKRLVFAAGTIVNLVRLEKPLVLSHKMTREGFVGALIEYGYEANK